MIHISRKDIMWSYFAQFFGVTSGIITLPLILRMLSAEEIGMNYLMLTIGSLVTLFDFGFSPQFGRNITYVYSGAQELKKEGLEIPSFGHEINYRLLSTLIKTARYVYRRLGIIVLTVMLSLGTIYIYEVTNGFNNIKNTLLIWIIYSISIFFNIYYSYYTSLLTGKGLIMEAKKAMVYSKLAYLAFTFIFLILGLGLLGITLANLIAPFVNRWVSYNYFFTRETKAQINHFEITTTEIKNLLNIIWHNAKKLGLVFVGSYAISKLSMFLAGLFLTLNEVASYGLMMQLVGLILTVSSTLFNVYQPKYVYLRIQNDNKQLIRLFSYSMNIFYILFILGSIVFVIIGPWSLSLIESNARLPAVGIMMLYLFIVFLEANHSNFAALIVTNNNIPFVYPSLIAGCLIGIGSLISLSFTNMGILGLVTVQGISQILYNNWKWPLVICKEFNITFSNFIYKGFVETKTKLRTLIND